MLTERFIASIGVPEKPPGTNVAKDAAIFIHEFQPLTQQRSIFKKSATPPNCLAVSRDHVFAAQSDKAVVHVYSREKGNQEATVPFTERITCLTLACDDTVLILGTAEGRIFLWETCTGRQVTTAQSHLQAVTALTVDYASNYLLSASADSTVHVWSIPALLSFANAGTQALSPLRTFTSHRAEVTALALGHSSGSGNFGVSASKDKMCLIWDYLANNVLRTYLLQSMPVCLTLDAADRAVYVGYEDGSVQRLDLYAAGSAVHDIDAGTAPIQPSESSRWRSPDVSKGAALSLALSFDSCTLLSGHQSGAMLVWDIASGRLQANIMQNPLPGPVTNLAFLPVTGFRDESEQKLKIPSVAKPKFGAFDSGGGTVPGNYAITVGLATDLTTKNLNGESAVSPFQQALTDPSFPQTLLDEGLAELASWNSQPPRPANGTATDEADDFMALDDSAEKPKQVTLEEQNAVLKAQLEAMRRLQMASFDKIDKINAERKALLKREQGRLVRRGMATTNGVDGVDSHDELESSDDGE